MFLNDYCSLLDFLCSCAALNERSATRIPIPVNIDILQVCILCCKNAYEEDGDGELAWSDASDGDSHNNTSNTRVGAGESHVLWQAS